MRYPLNRRQTIKLSIALTICGVCGVGTLRYGAAGLRDRAERLRVEAALYRLFVCNIAMADSVDYDPTLALEGPMDPPVDPRTDGVAAPKDGRDLKGEPTADSESDDTSGRAPATVVSGLRVSDNRVDAIDLEQQIQAAVAETSASLQRLEVGELSQRHWAMEDDDPNDVVWDGFGEPSGYVLVRQTAAINVHGDWASVSEVMRRLMPADALCSINRVGVSRIEPGRLEMQLEITYFALIEDDGSLDESLSLAARSRDTRR